MRITSFFLCDSARMRPDGTFDVVNGGVSETAQAAYPARLDVACVAVMEAEPDEYGPQRVEILLRDGNGRRLQAWRYPFELAPGQKGANLVLNLRQVKLPAPGDYLFDVRVNGKHLGPARAVQARLIKEGTS